MADLMPLDEALLVEIADWRRVAARIPDERMDERTAIYRCASIVDAHINIRRRPAPSSGAAPDAASGRAAPGDDHAPIHWLGDSTQDRDVWELSHRRERFTILGGPTTLYFAMDDGTPIIVPSGWWICDWHTAHPFVSSAAPLPGAPPTGIEGLMDAAFLALAHEYCGEVARLPAGSVFLAARKRLLDAVRALAAPGAEGEATRAPDDLEIERLLDVVLDASYALEQTEGDRTKERSAFTGARLALLQGIGKAKREALAPWVRAAGDRYEDGIRACIAALSEPFIGLDSPQRDFAKSKLRSLLSAGDAGPKGGGDR